MAIEQIKDLMDKKIITQVLPLDSEKITNMTEEELIEYGYITQVMSAATTESEVEPAETSDEDSTVEPVTITESEEESEDTPTEDFTVEPEEDDSPVVEEEE